MLVNGDGLRKHPRLLGIFKMRHPEYREYTNEELMNLLGYSYIQGGAKYRYVFLRGSKVEKRRMMRQIAEKVQPYPKADKKTDTRNECEMLEVV